MDDAADELVHVADVGRLALRSLRANLDRDEVRERLREEGVDSSTYAHVLWDLLTQTRDPRVKLRAAKLIAEVVGLTGQGGKAEGPSAATLHATVGLTPDMARLCDFAQRLEPAMRDELFDILRSGGHVNGQAPEVEDVACEV